MSIRKPSAVIAGLLLAVGLTACTSGPSDDILSDSPSETPGSSADAVPNQPVRVFPSVGQVHDVFNASTPGSSALELRCADGLAAVELDYLNGVEYNGTTLLFTHHTSDQDNNPGTSEKQISVTVEIGHLSHGGPFNPVAMIVSLQTRDSDAAGAPIPTYVDDQVVDLTPDMVTEAGLQLHTIDFNQDNSTALIHNLRFCVTP